MIVLFHNGNKPLNYLDTKTNYMFDCVEKTIQNTLYDLSNLYPDRLLIWCNEYLKSDINYSEIEKIFHHKLILSSYGNCDISKSIGYVDQHCFINVNKGVKYPTWLMSGDIGGAYANVIQKSKELLSIPQSFSFYLSSFAKLSMPLGLFTYSDPNLLLKNTTEIKGSIDNKSKDIFKFVKRHYKFQWSFILLFCLVYFNSKIYLWSFLKSLFVKRIIVKSINFNYIKVKSTKKNIPQNLFSIDVLIPTVGRKEHLFNVLKDLSKQTILPIKVIIIEQNDKENSLSELDYLNNDWPFKIEHILIHQLGACNARNIALSKVTSNWVFFADDDVRFEKDLLEKSYKKINQLGTNCIVMSCLQEGEFIKENKIIQSAHFGSGTSIVEANLLKALSFKKEHEFGYGEDSDFGMQLRNKGCEILNVPQISMLHLKASIGGFRAKFITKWSQETIQPKPSPTVMAFNLKHLTKAQLYGYKFLLFVKYYKNQSIKNPIKYIINFKKSWFISVKWAKTMMDYEN